ncbi:MAG: NADH:ubiquinone reductase (Na(+)-transporting) subunit F [Bacteroidales bacterium]|nr:NADH:ubiquinone reductase (Na(+)-transporting) subunit F [Bacteroidales bacterium]
MSTTSIIITSVIVFLIAVLIPVTVLVIVRKRLTPQGKVNIDINGDKNLEVEPGNSLLATLANEQIFLPSACGGGGNCGMCKCQVLEGGGTILPTETGFFSRKEQQNHWRLGCQVKVREDMKIHINPQIFGIKKWECEVVSNRNVATFIKEFKVKLPEGEHLNFKSGGYIQIDVPKIDVNYKDIVVNEEYQKDWEKFHMFDLVMHNPEPQFRAYSMANHPAEDNIIMLNVRIATPPFDRVNGGFMKVNPGVCSSYIYSLKPGDKVTISGPYGEFHVKDTKNEMIFIGGGAGMAPMRSHILDQFLTRHTDRKASFWYGGRSLRELFYIDDFKKIEAENPNFKFNIALSAPLPEDNWTGYVGNIHEVLFENYLKNHEAPEDIEYYLCGPPMMTQAVLKMLDNLGVPKDNIMFDDFGS